MKYGGPHGWARGRARGGSVTYSSMPIICAAVTDRSRRSAPWTCLPT